MKAEFNARTKHPNNASSDNWHRVWLVEVQKKWVETCSEATPRVTGLRSSAQNWSDVIAVFQMPYSHAIGQYSAVSMLVVMNMLEKF